MKLNVLTLNFWDAEDQRTVNTVNVYSTYEKCKLSLTEAQEEYGENVDYSIAFCTVDSVN